MSRDKDIQGVRYTQLVGSWSVLIHTDQAATSQQERSFQKTNKLDSLCIRSSIRKLLIGLHMNS